MEDFGSESKVLAGSERDLEAIVEAVPVAMVVLGAGGEIELFNSEAERLFGYRREEVLATPVERLVPELFRQADSVLSPEAQPMEAGRELAARRKDGREIPVETRLTPLEWGGEKRTLISIMDVSPRREVEDARRLSDDRFRVASQDHYLKREFYEELRSNPSVIEFLEAGSLDGIWYWDLDNPEHEWMSPNFWRTFGYEPEEKKHFASEWQHMIFPEDLEVALENFKKHCADPEHPYDQLVRYRHEDDSTVWVRCYGIAIRDAEGKPRRMLGVHNDVTATLQAAERVSDEHFRAFFEDSAVGAVYLDSQGRLSRVNDRYCEITGYSREELLGMVPSDLDHPDDIEADKRKVQRFFEGKDPVYIQEKRYLRKDGNFVWVHITASRICDESGKILAVAGIVQDITARKHAEQGLRESLAQFRGTFENAAVGMAHVAPDGHWLQVNERFCEIVGYSREELITKMFSDITHPDHREADWEQSRRVLSGEIPNYSSDKRYIRKDGSAVWIRITVSLMRRPDGEPEYFIAVMRDIDARKQAELKLEESLRSLREAQDELVRNERLATLGQLAGGVAHELRTPLTVLRNAVYYLEKTAAPGDPIMREVLDEMQRAIGSSDHIIGEMLDFVREPACEVSLFPIGETIDRALDLVPVPESIRLEGPEGEGEAEVHGNPEQITRILTNLIQNAVQAMPDGGALEICVSRESEKVSVEVRDTGGGIPEENLEKVFDPLFTTKTKGIGLGLAVSRRYAELNQGGLSVQSTPGTGATFRLVLNSNSPLDA
tara:strand:- start:3698 stop:6031 length:2334 start_codon:yes stop_codon:yes gene_type:complete